ncbi:TnsA-like heteromeric transposase endonuclease subunit [Kribbella caucasensis]|uniref:TnsA-like heteromeric transposase endonuclease subunit n=1 Tax=Kribbella caucasensis TaxID=2512215 RepID=UPI001060A93E|nr:TnsA-like heteromeric transposase endonuclease subunit [Kribbella sp. VKM Ac-2527]
MGGSLALGRTAPVLDFGLHFVGSDGQERDESLSSGWTVPFEMALPVRKFSSYRGQRSFSGLWWSSTISEHVGFESWLERDHVMVLDFDPAVVGLSSQPFRLSWRRGGKTRIHTPDYFARLRDGTGVVVDVRADDRIEPDDAEAFANTARACESVGWEFRRLGKLDEVLASNLRWLAGYRHPRCLHLGRATDLQRVFQTPAPLLEGTRLVGDPIAVLPTLFHLMWVHVLQADLASAPLSGSSMVWLRAGDAE